MYCFGTRPEILVTARAVQGASAVIVQVVGLALVADTMGASNVGSTMGWQSIAMFVGAISGPPLAGIVFEQAGHYAVFAMAYALFGFFTPFSYDSEKNRTQVGTRFG